MGGGEKMLNGNFFYFKVFQRFKQVWKNMFTVASSKLMVQFELFKIAKGIKKKKYII